MAILACRKKQHFKINRFDNSIWGTAKSRIFRLDNAGNFELWNETNVPMFFAQDEYVDIAFQPGETFVLSQNTGLYSFNGAARWLVNGSPEGLNLSTDADTLWITHTSSPFEFYYSSQLFTGFTSGPRRMVAKNGTLTSSSDNKSGVLVNRSLNSFYLYNTNNDPYYLGNQNYDFKFSPTSDTLFTSSNRGFSLAVNGVFVDTITKYNTTNMPDLSITEFELDALGNIWAVFSPPAYLAIMYPPEKIAYLDRSTNTWSQIFDNTNSPINFGSSLPDRPTIEMDTAGNLWVANGTNLHVLELNAFPAWLNTEELTKPKANLRIFPNPSSGKLNITTNAALREIVVFNLQGKEILKTTPKTEIVLPTGVFLVQITAENGEVWREKVVVE